MDYPLENLSPEKFQHLCQALLVRDMPNVQCMPIGQPDGGRDAVQWYTPDAKNFVVYQVKFVRNPNNVEDILKWAQEIIEQENEKVVRLRSLGASEYILISNLSASSHLGVGSIDKVQAALTEKFGIPSMCWWRNDISRRLDGAWDLKWRFQELMTGSDIVRLVFESGLAQHQERRSTAILAFLATQFAHEQEVKFKQVELKNRLLELFIDVPVSFQSRHYHSDRWDGSIEIYNEDPLAEVDWGVPPQYRNNREPIGAATALLRSTKRANTFVVLEGAPGQGKSTITQYICQVHRLRLLKKNSDFALVVASHLDSPLRIPIRVDLRDYALWLSRKNPFSQDAEDLPPAGWSKGLESFLAALIRHLSGGADFSATDFHAILRISAVLIVLDGLDEVADIKVRKEVVEEIEKASVRLKEMAASIQIVVTSRPAAFENSPGLTEQIFAYFSLESLTRDLIDEYADKWLRARQIQERESSEAKKILKEKLDQPHIRDLARNPMQLAILLSLIQKRGRSLPDKRTALYDAYMELFFDRESEKSSIVREHREILIDIHRYLAWLLHTDAERQSSHESGRARGAITAQRLVETLREYLHAEARDPSLAEVLFTGVAERVMALVSRIEGTYEFEVQPLREYFAARFLFETAPYSPPGNEQKGTRPDRFDAISRNFYWLNVTRFYCGCYSKGELASLIDRLHDLAVDKDFRYLSHPRILAATLLGDWVFAQHPRSVKLVMKLMLDELGLRFVLTSSSRRLNRSQSLILPRDCGQPELVEHCLTLLETQPPDDLALDVIDLLRANGTPVELLPRWWDATNKVTGSDRMKWVYYGLHLGCLSIVDEAGLAGLIREFVGDDRVLEWLIRAKRVNFLESDPVRFEHAVKSVLELKVQGAGASRSADLLGELVHAVDVSSYAIAFGGPQSSPLASMWKSRDRGINEAQDLLGIDGDSMIIRKCVNVIKASRKEANQDLVLWSRSVAPWDTLVEAIRREFGDKWSAAVLATVAAGIKSTTEICLEHKLLFDHSSSLCMRLRYARLRAGVPAWWLDNFQKATTEFEKMLLCLVLITWGGRASLKDTISLMDKIVVTLCDESWKQLFDGVKLAIGHTGKQSGERHLTVDFVSATTELSVRTWALILLRSKPNMAASIYVNHLHAYRGGDDRVLKVVHSNALKLLSAGKGEWHRELEAVQHCFSSGVIADPYTNQFFMQRASKLHLPIKLAQRVVENPGLYPTYIVASAENRMREKVFKVVVPIAKVATDQGWFAHEDR